LMGRPWLAQGRDFGKQSMADREPPPRRALVLAGRFAGRLAALALLRRGARPATLARHVDAFADLAQGLVDQAERFTAVPAVLGPAGGEMVLGDLELLFGGEKLVI